MQLQRLQKTFTYTAIITGLFGIVLQFVLMLQSRQAALPEAIIRFFSYFTILSNCMVVLYFICHVLPARQKFHRFVQQNETGTATAMYIIVVGVVYQTILRQPVPLLGWHRVADDILHAYIPLLMLLYWIIFLSSQKTNLQTIPYWLIYPVVYLVYTLLRGSVADFYPYPFVAVNKLGYGKVLLNSTLLVLFFLGLSFLFAGIANWRFKNKSVGNA